MTKHLQKLADIYEHYDLICSDVWGVLHNGVESFQTAVEALKSARKAGKTVVLITNSPRRKNGVAEQLEALGVTPDSWDEIITSGEMTRILIEQADRDIFFIGPDRDHNLLEGFDVNLVDDKQAKTILCTGLFNDETEKPEDYQDMLQGMLTRNVPFICANPDLIVERGNRLIPCAGAVAALYKKMGGDVFVAGKPHPPMYKAAIEFAEKQRGSIDKSRVIAIGDALPTDVKGAIDYGLDLVFVAHGIHIAQFGDHTHVDPDRLSAFLAKSGVRPEYWMEWLK